MRLQLSNAHGIFGYCKVQKTKKILIFYRATLSWRGTSYDTPPICPSVRPSVCHKPFRSDCTNRAGFRYDDFLPPILHLRALPDEVITAQCEATDQHCDGDDADEQR